MWDQLLTGIIQGNSKSLARAISLVENEVPGFEHFLQQLPAGHTPVTGITGPPGAGKSTLVDAMIATWVAAGKRVAVLCVDPSSPFNLGALLGDRIRMNEWYNNPNVFIRSLATRGSLGGLHPHIIEITAILQVAGFDHIIVETVGVGQSEIEIAGLADVTVVVVVPEAGDEVQTMKAGLMEIADIFVVNKSDRPDADTFVKNLRMMLAPAFNTDQKISVVKTVASARKGVDELCKLIDEHVQLAGISDRKHWLMTERVYQLIQKTKMKGFDKAAIKKAIAAASAHPGFNLFTFAQQYLNESEQ
ncbi:MAG: methylmalonyl Co-A mutase-associated GTPase MeaB [Sphingobacteriia bacterium]|nr:methylmalonyl Co-A mutase-associated GTPase MeaB [Sphingobacteriia bacterium]